ncbi:peptidylprolyl isomerase [Hoeflea prorocentri]|uniref:Parvulin-like PPIase n=1 Tax=Hoeflea prorocentri TaxID=1922333 RepID=A0A9X3ZGF4_9HYPH|nr:peptidylprolyl isomerase [Hoeflea prorocentri]MCY6380712.1 SurA N-terminal domain-containing protein [Hoeflea prorocentri]MDA5398512.1 SurA N-terminal domain-containing protein [Hoeflea prorocentri]
MLDSLRNSAKSWVVKAFLMILVLSFGVWGISGTVFQGTGGSVVTVGETRVTPLDFRLAYDRQLAALSRQFGTRLTTEQARSMGLENQILVQVAMNAALDEQSRRMNLGLSKDRLANLIAEDPAFQGIDGRFDRTTFAALLRNVGMTEEDYIVSQENAAIRSQIVEAISDGYEAPSTLLRAISQYDNETRTIDYILLNSDAVDAIAEPTQEQIQNYFEENKAAYRAPEYRKIAYVTLRATDIADPTTISDDTVRSDYQTYIDRFRTPETRTIQQLSFPDGDAAKAAADAIAAGGSFEEIVQEQGTTSGDITLGTFERDTVPDQSIAEAAFSISEEGGTSGVVEGAFGPVIIRVTKITPEATRSFDDVKEDIRNDLALGEAEAILFDVHNAYEDLRAGGDTMQEAARKQRLTPVVVDAVDRSARTPDGTVLRDLPESRDLLAQAFDTEIGVEVAPLNLGTDGYLWFEVQDVMPARDRSLDEVRDRVIEDWKREQTGLALGELATQLQKRVEDGEEITAVAADRGLVTNTKYEFKRSDEDAVLGPVAVAAAFGGPDGLVAVADDAGGASKILLKVSSVTKPTAGSAQLADQLTEAVSARMGDDMLTQAIAQMQSEFGVSYNPAAAELALSPGH